MFNRKSLRSRVLATSSAAALCVVAAGASWSGAIAQEGEQEAAQERIVVTGSRIVRQDFTANSPIVTVDTETFQNTSSLTVESVLNTLPQFTQDARSEFRTTSVEPTTDQSPGTAQVNLRGLGSNRSLVLIDGRRAQPVNGAMAVDVNVIPSAAIQRVEIISGGASAVYGADAVGGVVNFILKDNFEGAEISGRYGITERGDAESTQISALLGADFADGRGNVMFGADLSNRGPALLIDRDWAVEQARDIHSFSNPFFGTWAPSVTTYLPNQAIHGLPPNPPSQAEVDAIFPNRPPGTTVARTATLYINPTSANPDLTDPSVGTLFTSGQIGAANGFGGYKYTGPFEHPDYPGCPWRVQKYDTTVLELPCFAEISSPLDRYSLFGRGRYEINDSLTVTVRGNYASTYTRSVLQQAAGSFIVPHGNEIWTGNEYSPSSLLNDGVTTHPDYVAGGRYGLNCAPTGGCTRSEVFPVPVELAQLLDSRNDPNADFVLSTTTWWGPPRGSSTRNDVFQVELGLEGTLDDLLPWAENWTWDASVSHGETHSIYLFDGFGSLGRFRAIASSPNYGVGFDATGNPDFGGTGAGSGSCLTGLPIIRTFQPSEDCVEAYEAVMQNSIYIEQNVAEANLTGDLFELPAGTLQFAVGASYRDAYMDFVTDPLNDLLNFYDQPLGLFPKTSSSGYLSVQEVYGELLVPVVGGLPFVENLSLELGGRISDYDPSGQVETYKGLVDWQITDFMRLRGGYNRATRAPNLNELYAARSQTVAVGGFITDPCSRNNTAVGMPYTANPATNAEGAAGAAHAEQVCRNIMARDSVAAGHPANLGADAYYSQDFDVVGNGGGGTAVVKGNPNIQPESADTWTAGLVVTSPFPDNPILSGFSGSVDWYQIEIADLIAVASPNALMQDCFSLANNPTADPNTFACSRFLRDPINGDGVYFDRTYTNQGWARLSGVDVQLNWRGEFEDVGLGFIPGGTGVSVLATFPIEQLTQGTPTAAVIDGVGTQYSDLQIGGGAFDYTTLTTLNYFVGDWSASLRWQYTPPIEAAGYATANPRGNTTAVGVPKGASLFDISASYRLNDTVTLRAGVDNLLDAEPPLSGTPGNCIGDPLAPLPAGAFRDCSGQNRALPGIGSSGAGAGAYDVLGRRYFVGFTLTY